MPAGEQQQAAEAGQTSVLVALTIQDHAQKGQQAE
jgi:hypothetical protein